jgi:predicted Holliday junction resolvase-like endonuclease
MLTLIALIIGALIVKLYKDREIALLKKDITLLNENLEQYIKNLENVSQEYNKQVEANKTLISQKSSISTRSGNYVETLAPLLEQFPVDIFDKNNSLKFLGDPIDYICFSWEKPEILLIEVKSGDSSLSTRQKLIKKMVQEGLIRFIEYRMDVNGKIRVK